MQASGIRAIPSPLQSMLKRPGMPKRLDANERARSFHAALYRGNLGVHCLHNRRPGLFDAIAETADANGYAVVMAAVSWQRHGNDPYALGYCVQRTRITYRPRLADATQDDVGVHFLIATVQTHVRAVDDSFDLGVGPLAEQRPPNA